MIPPVRRSSSAFRPPAPSFAAQSHFSAKALKVLPKEPKIACSAAILRRNRTARTLLVLMDLGVAPKRQVPLQMHGRSNEAAYVPRTSHLGVSNEAPRKSH